MQYLISHQYADKINFRFTGAATFCKVDRDISLSEVMQSIIIHEDEELQHRTGDSNATYFVHFNEFVDSGDILIKISPEVVNFTGDNGMRFTKVIINLS